MQDYLRDILWFIGESTYARRGANPEECDFCFGNPQEMPLPAVHEAITRWAAPQNKDWFAYKFSEPSAVKVAVESLKERHGMNFESADVTMTNGAFGALSATLRAIVDPGDEVIYLAPPWFFYVPMIISLGGRAVKVELPAPGFELPVGAIQQAITERTRAVIINSPHNPSGRIFQPEELEALAALLRGASHPIYLISDESYSRILFDGRPFHTPVRYYDRSFLVYTYGKTLLIPGQRVGYVAMPPSMPDREELRAALMTAQMVNGWGFPNAVMQYALGDLEQASIDVRALQRRRDRIVSALGEMGYHTVRPAGTFYVLVRSPLADEVAFTERLALENVFVMPGRVFELPGWFRISLTANDDMVERSLPGFAKALAGIAVTASDSLPGKV
ncbi:MAG TPA: aminotransferase class I/II-fold pyridoxal phosphate-dependent enzyme [Candidatus Dormibacteraeota bacterium]|nr:aminotransferase class I/II-fold pyridoxal phosphate-dependent enzyme [Candidatus Dormibacteraeota bacterium]